MSVLTIGAFMHDLNIGDLKKQSKALDVFKEQIGKGFHFLLSNFELNVLQSY